MAPDCSADSFSPYTRPTCTIPLLLPSHYCAGTVATCGSLTPSPVRPRTRAPRPVAAQINAAALRKPNVRPVAVLVVCVLPLAAAPVPHPLGSAQFLSNRMVALVGTSMIANLPIAMGFHPLAKRLHWDRKTLRSFRCILWASVQ